MRDPHRTMRMTAYCAMSTLASRMSDARRLIYGTPPGSPQRVALADLRTRMDDQRVAFSIAASGGDMNELHRNGYRPAGYFDRARTR